jgi:hypothetical protein
MRDSTCVAFEINLPTLDSRTNSSLLQELINAGERILDLVRLFLFRPGEDKSIGHVGAIGNGVSGVWLGDDAEHLQFIARKNSNYQLAQDPLEVPLADVRRIYNDAVFRELCSAAASLNSECDSLLDRIFQTLRAFRESRDIQSLEARFRQLAGIAEDLAKRDKAERLSGERLRDYIAKIAENGWRAVDDVRAVTRDLWDNARNPLTHSVETFASIGRDANLDIDNMELIVVNMVEAVVIAWRNERFGIDAYDSLLST